MLLVTTAVLAAGTFTLPPSGRGPTRPYSPRSPRGPRPRRHRCTLMTRWFPAAPAQRGDSAAEADLGFPDLSALGGWWNPRRPSHHGDSPIAGGFRVAILPGRTWAYTPETCHTRYLDTIGVLGGRIRLCAGCGLAAA